MRIGIIEDEEQMRKEVADLLKRYDYEVFAYLDYEHIVEEVGNQTPDLLLLDVNLPYKDGYEICREIRGMLSIPIIMLTAQDSAMEEVMALKSGADDFVAKPYHPQVLLAHIETVLSRTKEGSDRNGIACKGLILNLNSGTIKYQNREMELTKNEIRILALLMERQGNIVSRDDLMNALWQDGQFVDENTLNVNVGRLRKKIEEIGLADFIHTKRGMGYNV